MVFRHAHPTSYCSPHPSPRSKHTGLFALQLHGLMPPSRSLTFQLPLIWNLRLTSLPPDTPYLAIVLYLDAGPLEGRNFSRLSFP